MLIQMVAGGPTGPIGGVKAAAAPSPTLSIGFLQTIDSLNPYRGLNDPSYLLYGLLYDYPFAFDQDGNLIPNLITSANCVTPACTEWTYTVRQGVYWSDGTRLTPADVNFTFNYDSQNLAKLWAFEPYFNQVVQCTSSNVGHCGAMIDPNNPQNVLLFFQRPFSPGKDVFAPIVEAAQWSKVQPSAAYTSYTNANPIGTGPFIADPNIYNEFLNMPTVPIHVTRNPRYHPLQGTQVATTNITDIYLWTFNDPATLVAALNTGAIQLAQLPTTAYGTIQGPAITQVGLQAIQEWNEIGISQDNSSKLNVVRLDTAFRQALAHATNKDYIVQQEYAGFGQRGDSLISPIVPWWYDPVKGGDNLTFSIPLANQILNQSGYTVWSGGTFGSGIRSAAADRVISYEPPCYRCANPPNTTVTIPAGTALSFKLAVRPPSEFPEELATAQYLQAQWAQIGVSITIKQESTETALSKDVYAGAVDMYIWYWSSDQDPNYMLSMESSWTLDGWNDNYWNNGTYNQLYLKQLGDLNYTQRLADVKAAQKVQYESASYIIYIFPYGVWSMRYDVWTGWGDWNAHPYRQMSAFWGANPLWFSISCPNCTYPSQKPPPTAPTIVPGGTITRYVNQTTFFNATTTDTNTRSTDLLNWTWYWGDATSSTNLNVTNPTGTVTVENSHLWNTTGTYTVYTTVYDGVNAPVASSNQVTVNVIPLPLNPGTLRGNVTDSKGIPLGAVAISAQPGGVTTTTAADGTYSLILAAGAYNITANKTLFTVQTANGVTVTAGKTTYKNFVLTSNAGWITGTVTSSTTKNPIAGALVKITSSTNAQAQNTTNASGGFNFTVGPGTYTVNVTASSYYGTTITDVKVTTGVATTLPVQLNPVVQPQPGLDPLVVAAVAAVVIIAAVGVLVVLLSRRRKAKEKEEGKLELPPKSP